ncbi:MAG: hypothetical protein OXD54_15335 [Candidatus Poribacteria bacterium]|nr:hypothetical protein [Candidatus Poribacteria bacterium]
MRTKWKHNNRHSFHPRPILRLLYWNKGKCSLSYHNFAILSLLCFSFVVFFSVFVGCGYVSTSSYLEHIKTINIPPIEIQDADFAYDDVSQRPFDEVIHEKLTRHFNRKWNDGNDCELTIKINDYHIKEHGFGPSGNVEMLRMSLQVEYQFLDKVRNNLIERRDNHVQIHDFYVVDNRGEPPETVDQAKNLIIDELIEDLYNQLAEQW